MPPHISLLDPDAAADHRSRLLAVARSLCGSTHLAEDLTQETYARVLSKPRRLGDGADFPYLVRALRNPEAAPASPAPSPEHKFNIRGQTL